MPPQSRSAGRWRSCWRVLHWAWQRASAAASFRSLASAARASRPPSMTDRAALVLPRLTEPTIDLLNVVRLAAYLRSEPKARSAAAHDRRVRVLPSDVRNDLSLDARLTNGDKPAKTEH
jgi:hypothetical protein